MSFPYADLLASAGSPAQPRLAAMQRFQALGWPRTRDEAWKYTDLRLLQGSLARLSATAGSLDESWLAQQYLLDGKQADRVVFVDGRYAGQLSQLSSAIAAHLQMAPELTAAPPAHGSAALSELNRALAQGGLNLNLPAGLRIDRPLYCVYVSSADDQRAVALRSRIQLGAGAGLTLIEHFVGTGSGFTSVDGQGHLAPGAAVNLIRIQQEAASRHHLAQASWSVDREARLQQIHIDLGGRLVRQSSHVDLTGPGADTGYYASGILSGRQHLDHHLTIAHSAPQGRSRVQARGISNDGARNVFSGRIIVAPGAQQSDSAQMLRNLLLSDQAEADARPELEIFADDVKCAHGATVGRLDESALFYLRSRGIDESQARTLLTISFAEEILQYLPLSELRESLATRIEQRLNPTASPPA